MTSVRRFHSTPCDGAFPDRLATSLHDIPEAGENLDSEYYTMTSEAHKSPFEALLDPSNKDVSHIIRHSLEGALFAHIQASHPSKQLAPYSTYRCCLQLPDVWPRHQLLAVRFCDSGCGVPAQALRTCGEVLTVDCVEYWNVSVSESWKRT